MKEPRVPEALARLGPGELLVNEMFTSIQGESSHAGRPCFFIRLTGCHLRCAWCDTGYAFYEGKVLNVRECVQRAEESGQRLVEVTGGEPLLQDSVHQLLPALCDRDLEVLLETSGSLPLDRVDHRVRRVVDWKCPGSGMEASNRADVIASLREGDELKLVIRDRSDYEWARASLPRLLPPAGPLAPSIPVLFSPALPLLEADRLASWILEDRLPVRLNLQIHKYLWPGRHRGV